MHIDLARRTKVTLESDWLVAYQGSDESAQEIRLKVWGRLREHSHFARGFEQLDGDAEEEYFVISCIEGTGPYYKLQILDFRPDGMFTWSYDSFGRPKIKDKKIYLGLHEQYDGASDISKYAKYRYTTEGLVPVD